MSKSLSIRGCKVASAALVSTSDNTELSPSTGARRLKYRNTAGRPPLLENVNQTQTGKHVCWGGNGGLDLNEKLPSFMGDNVSQTITHPFYLPPAVAVTPVSLLQPFDPGVALLRRPQVSHGGHLLRYVGEYVPVADAGFQAVLHVICSPHLNESDRLLLRPCCVYAICNYF